MDEQKIFKGKLYLHSEQGMEGGYLSFIDLNFIDFKAPPHGLSENTKVYEDSPSTKHGITSNPEMLYNNVWIPLRDPILDDVDYKKSSLWLGEEQGDFEADQRLMTKYGFKLQYTQHKADKIYGPGNWKFIEPNSKIELKNGDVIIMGGTPNSIPKRPYTTPNSDQVRVTVKWNDGTIETKRLSNTLLIESWSYEGLHTLNDDDLIIIREPNNQNIIAQGTVGKIPLTTFSQTKDGHFSKSTLNWKTYFEEGYIAEIRIHNKTTTNTVYSKQGKSWLKKLFGK